LLQQCCVTTACTFGKLCIPESKELQHKHDATIPSKDNDADNTEDDLKTDKYNLNGVQNNVSSQHICLPEEKIQKTKE